MEREQVQILHETANQVRHTLAGILSSLELVIDEFDTLSPDFKARFEDTWHKTYLQSIEGLSQSLQCFAQNLQIDTPPAVAPPANGHR